MNRFERAAVRFFAGRLRKAPAQRTQAYPSILGVFGRSNSKIGTTQKPSPANLRNFARTSYARAAINTVKNPISALKWELQVEGEASNTKTKADALLACMRQPNNADTFRSLVEQLTEDLLSTGEGYFEHAAGADKFRPLWMWPVDSTTMEPLAEWDGNPASPRFVQCVNPVRGTLWANTNAKKFAARDICFMRLNPSTDNPCGLGPLEVAYDAIQRKLGVGQYAANVASNAQPQNLIYAGDMDTETLNALRGYWNDEIEGQGTTPILGGKVEAKVVRMHAGTDDALYLKWQEFLIREIATAFGISPMNMGLEGDVNRNTAEVGHDRDFDRAVVPMARLIEEHINIDIIQRRMGLVGVKFAFIGLDREDEQANAEIFATLYQNNAILVDEWRESNGMKPMPNQWGQMTFADMQIAIKAAQGSAQVDDPTLTKGQPQASKPAATKPSASKAKQRTSGKQTGGK